VRKLDSNVIHSKQRNCQSERNHC